MMFAVDMILGSVSAESLAKKSGALQHTAEQNGVYPLDSFLKAPENSLFQEGLCGPPGLDPDSRPEAIEPMAAYTQALKKAKKASLDVNCVSACVPVISQMSADGSSKMVTDYKTSQFPMNHPSHSSTMPGGHDQSEG